MVSSSDPGSRWRCRGAALLLALLGAGALATAVGAARYPGGSWVDPRSGGHWLWGNFLCDIARDVAVNGQPSPGASWGRAAEWTLLLALWLFWWLVAASSTHAGGDVPSPRWGRSRRSGSSESR